MIFLGIDCGVTGAAALIDDSEHVLHVFDLPVATRGRLTWLDGPEFIGTVRQAMRGYETQVTRACVESLQPRPGFSAQAQLAKGLMLGSLLSCLYTHAIAFDLTQPAVWKRALGLQDAKATDAQKKKASLDLARQSFPDAADALARVRDHNRAEALLIAMHYRRHVWGGTKGFSAAQLLGGL